MARGAIATSWTHSLAAGADVWQAAPVLGSCRACQEPVAPMVCAQGSIDVRRMLKGNLLDRVSFLAA